MKAISQNKQNIPTGTDSNDYVDMSTGQVHVPISLMSLNAGTPPFSAFISYTTAHNRSQIGKWNNESDTGLIAYGWNSNLVISAYVQKSGSEDEPHYLLYINDHGYSLELIKKDGDVEVYKTKSYSLFQIKHYLNNDKSRDVYKTNDYWEVISESGLKYIMGYKDGIGVEESSAEYKKVADKIVIDKSLDKVLASPVVAFVGWEALTFVTMSNNVEGQEYRLKRWNLSHIEDPIGNRTVFYYINHVQHVCPDGVEPTGLTYTIQSYLYKIVAVPVSNRGQEDKSHAIHIDYQRKENSEYSHTHLLGGIRLRRYQQSFGRLYIASLSYYSAGMIRSSVVLNTELLPPPVEDSKLDKRSLQQIIQKSYSSTGGERVDQILYEFTYYTKDDGVSCLGVGFDDVSFNSLKPVSPDQMYQGRYFNPYNGALYGALKTMTLSTGEKKRYTYDEHILTHHQYSYNLGIHPKQDKPAYDPIVRHTSFGYSILSYIDANNHHKLQLIEFKHTGECEVIDLASGPYNESYNGKECFDKYFTCGQNRLAFFDFDFNHFHVYQKNVNNGKWEDISSEFEGGNECNFYSTHTMHIQFTDKCLSILDEGLPRDGWRFRVRTYRTDDDVSWTLQKRVDNIDRLPIHRECTIDESLYGSLVATSNYIVLVQFARNNPHWNLGAKVGVWVYNCKTQKTTHKEFADYPRMKITSYPSDADSEPFLWVFPSRVTSLRGITITENIVCVNISGYPEVVRTPTLETKQDEQWGVFIKLDEDDTPSLLGDDITSLIEGYEKYDFSPTNIQSSKFVSVFQLSEFGMERAIQFAYKHGDDYPIIVSLWETIGADGKTVKSNIDDLKLVTFSAVNRQGLDFMSAMSFVGTDKIPAYKQVFFFRDANYNWRQLKTGSVVVPTLESQNKALEIVNTIFNILNYVMMVVFTIVSGGALLPAAIARSVSAIIELGLVMLPYISYVISYYYGKSVNYGLNGSMSYLSRFSVDNGTIWFHDDELDHLTAIGAGESFQPNDILSEEGVTLNEDKLQAGRVYNVIPFFSKEGQFYYRRVQNNSVGTLHNLSTHRLMDIDDQLSISGDNQTYALVGKKLYHLNTASGELSAGTTIASKYKGITDVSAATSYEGVIHFFKDDMVCTHDGKNVLTPWESIDIAILGIPFIVVDAAIDDPAGNGFYLFSRHQYAQVNYKEGMYSLIRSGELKDLNSHLNFPSISSISRKDNKFLVSYKQVFVEIDDFLSKDNPPSQLKSFNLNYQFQTLTVNDKTRLDYMESVVSVLSAENSSFYIYQYHSEMLGGQGLNHVVREVSSYYDKDIDNGKASTVKKYEFMKSDVISSGVGVYIYGKSSQE